MSAFKNAIKRKIHKERPQPKARQQYVFIIIVIFIYCIVMY